MSKEKKFDYNIVLIGFMGAGKSTVADYLRTIYDMDIVEMDQVIADREGMSILLVTHDSRVASRCNWVFFMEDGKITGEYILGKYEDAKKYDRETELNKWLEIHG